METVGDDNPKHFGSSPNIRIKGEKTMFIKVLEIKGIQKGKVNKIKDDTTVLSIPKKKTYKQYIKEISKLNF